MTAPRILIVDDEASLVEVLAYNFTREGFEVDTAHDGREALQKCRLAPPDVVVLDVMIPLIDGLQVCRQIRSDAKLKDVRVLLLTARGEETDEVVGFNLGADDYVAKPFRTRPLIERVKALVRRRSGAEADGDTLSIGSLEIDRVRHSVSLHGRELPMTPTEFKLLWTLVRQPGRAFSRHELLDCCRGEDANSMERTIDVHVRALRKKLGNDEDVIETVRGVGYRCRTSAE
ncbi:MAG: response regulator transcription factor [Pirellulales bacterium]